MSVIFLLKLRSFFVWSFVMNKIFKMFFNWFSREEFTCSGGYGAIWKIAYPLILMNASFTVMSVSDRIFLSRSSTLEMSAAPVGGNLYFWLFSFFTVTSNFTGAIISQLHGAGRKKQLRYRRMECFLFRPCRGVGDDSNNSLCRLLDH